MRLNLLSVTSILFVYVAADPDYAGGGGGGVYGVSSAPTTEYAASTGGFGTSTSNGFSTSNSYSTSSGSSFGASGASGGYGVSATPPTTSGYGVSSSPPTTGYSASSSGGGYGVSASVPASAGYGVSASVPAPAGYGVSASAGYGTSGGAMTSYSAGGGGRYAVRSYNFNYQMPAYTTFRRKHHYFRGIRQGVRRFFHTIKDYVGGRVKSVAYKFHSLWKGLRRDVDKVKYWANCEKHHFKHWWNYRKQVKAGKRQIRNRMEFEIINSLDEYQRSQPQACQQRVNRVSSVKDVYTPQDDHYCELLKQQEQQQQGGGYAQQGGGYAVQ